MPAAGDHWPRDALPEGTNLFGYRIAEVLGRGGFGITYRAADRIEQQFAIKECFPRQFAIRQGVQVLPTDDEAADSFNDCLDRFIREARALLQLSRVGDTGDGVVKVVTSFDTNGTAYIVMEFLGGQSLETLIKENPGGIDPQRLETVLTNLLHAVGCAHDAGLLHRDIKPSNILLRENGRPVLIDFGAVRSVTGAQTQTFTQIYSETYAPIEQITGESQGPYSDIYAVGATCYRAIGGIAVNALARHLAVTSGKPDPLVPAVSLGAGRYPAPVLRAIDAALQVAVKDRPQSVRAFLDLLAPAPAEAEDHTVVRIPPRARPAPRPDPPRPEPKSVAPRVVALAPVAPAPVAPVRTPAPAGAGRSRRPIGIGAGLAAAVAVAAVGIGVVFWPHTPADPNAVVLDLRTTPPGAAIRIDGRDIGTTPLHYTTAAGKRLIEASLDGYKPYSRSIEAKPGERLPEDLYLKALPATVAISTEPPGAVVRIDDKPAGTSPLQQQLDAGPHRLQAALEGFEPQELSIDPKPGKTLRRDLKLVPLPATLAVDTTPTGASVSLDGRLLGKAPLQQPVPPGAHRLEAVLEGYQPQSVTIEPQPGKALHQSLNLAAIPARLVVDTVPTGAAISIDDKPAGKAPLQTQIAPGTHRIEARLDGYQPQSLAIDPQPGKTLHESLDLAAVPATLVIATTPAGAAISIDDKPAGKAPLQTQVAPGTHRVEARLDGYQPQSLTIEPQPGKTLQEPITMVALPATIDVTTTPSGAKVSIDDSPAGASPLHKQLAAGTHNIQATLEGHQPQSRSVVLLAGQTLPVNLDLPTVPPVLSDVPTPAFNGEVIAVLDPRTLLVSGKGPVYLFGIRVKNLNENQQQANRAQQQMMRVFRLAGDNSVECYNGPQTAATPAAPPAYRCFTKNKTDVAQWAVKNGLAEFDAEATSSH